MGRSFSTAVYLINRLPTSAFNYETPYFTRELAGSDQHQGTIS